MQTNETDQQTLKNQLKVQQKQTKRDIAALYMSLLSLLINLTHKVLKNVLPQTQIW